MSSIPGSAPSSGCPAASVLVEGRVEAVAGQVLQDLVRLSDGELGEVLAAALRGRALMEGLAFALSAEAESRGVIAASCAAGTAQWVQAQAEQGQVPMATSVAKAYAEVVEATRSPGLGELKAATRSGQVPVVGAAVVAREFRRMQPLIDPACHEPALQGLISYCAAGASGRQLGQARDAIVAQYGIATQFQDECDQRASFARFSGFRRTRDGMYAAYLELDPAAHAVVEAALGALAAPVAAPDGAREGRSPDKRRADALVELCSVVATDPALLARSGQTPQGAQPGRAARAQVVLTMPRQWLHEQTGYATTAFGQPIAPGDARRIACDAGIIPAVLGSPSQPLDLGRRVRLATAGQRAALALRDHGCSFPGCDRPPGWCAAHHLIEWADGGNSDLDNLALLCTRHHTIVHRDHLHGRLQPGPDGPRITWTPQGSQYRDAA